MATEDLVPLRTVGRYQVVEEIGRGAMGVVYRGFDPVIGRAVALKTIVVGAVAEDAAEFRQRLFREASAAGALAHPNIVTIHDVVHDADTTAVAMEFVEGETLASMIARRAPLPIDEALVLMEQICSGLDYAAARGIVHRDIKPANILVGLDGRPRIADFGIARLPASTFTMSGAVLGSAGYMSPEQVRGGDLDARSDLFSAATVFYEMLTGRNPFSGTEAANTLYRIVHEAAAPMRTLNPLVPTAIEHVMTRALAKDPSARFATGAALTQALGAAAGGPRSRAGHVSADGASTRPRALLVLGVVGLVGAIGVAVMMWLRAAPPSASPAPTVANAPSGVPTAVPPVPSSVAATPAPMSRSAVPDSRASRPAATASASASASRDVTTSASRGAPPTAQTTAPPAPSIAAPPIVPAPIPSVPAPPVPTLPGGAATPIAKAPPAAEPSAASAPAALPPAPTAAPAAVPAAPPPPPAAAPAFGSAVATVKGEAYAGVRIFVDDVQVALPYPAQLPRLSGGAHVIRFAWVSGPLAGKALTQSFDVKTGGHLLIRAVPENDQVVVQQIR